MSNRFTEVFDNLIIPEDYIRELLQKTEVVRITASMQRGSLTVFVKCDDELPGVAISRAEDAVLKAVFPGKHVRVTVENVSEYAERQRIFSGSLRRSDSGADTKSEKTSRPAFSNPPQKKNEAQKPEPKPGQKSFKTAFNKWTPKTNKKSDNPDVIYGYDFSGEPIAVKNLEEGMGDVIVTGFTFNLDEPRKTKNDKLIFKFNLTDNTDSIACRLLNVDSELLDTMNAALKPGKCISISGALESPNMYEKEIYIRVKNIKKADISFEKRTDNAEEKRTELHLHTKMSDMDGLGDVSDYIKMAEAWGWESLAITDRGSVQAFPEASHSLSKDSKLKLIYGYEGDMVDDLKKSVVRPCGQLLSGKYVVFDIETTGLSPLVNKIIEFGAVKIENGVITDRFSKFVDPEEPIPYKITELTSITDDDVRGQGNIDKILPEFMDFCEDAVIVAHNAGFDTGFVGHFAKERGYEYDPTIIDTVGLSMLILTNLKRFKLDTVARELGVSLENHHRAVDDAEATAGIFLRLCDRLKDMGINDLDALCTYEDENADMIIKKRHPSHVTILIKSDLGRTNLYRLVSAAHIDYFHTVARIPKSLLSKLRNGLLIGSGCINGELYDELLRGASDEDAMEIADFYDFLEVQPPENYMYLTEDEKSTVRSREDIQAINKRIIEIGKKLGKPVVATGDVHFKEPGDAIFRNVIKYNHKATKYVKDKALAPLYLRTTDEMLEAFSDLDRQTAYEIVIKNPKLISNMCERISPVRPDKCPPVIPNSDQDLRDICNKKAMEMYGEDLPEEVSVRLNKELDSIISNGYSVMYIIAQKLVKDSNDHGYLVGSRGSVGSSLVATMAGISEVNPLPPHYYCPKCHYNDFKSEEVKSFAGMAGCDMPDKVCPICGAPLIKDGYDIPFETFLGFKGDKEPDIDLNFSGDYQSKAHAYTEVIFGKGQTFKAGTVGTVKDKTAYGYVLKYNEENDIRMRRAEVERIANGCTGVRRTTGQHPGGIVVLPHGEEINSFTPIQHPANDMDNPITTHFEYHSIDHNLLKLDILGKDDPTMVRMLFDLTGLDPMDIPIGVPEVMSLFQNTEALGISPDDIGGTKCGTLGIPEFGTDFAIQMLLDAKPKYVSDLVRIAGLAHGTDVWVGNAQKLINEGKCTIQTAICTRDDIMIYLIQKGLDPGDAFSIMELVRKGKFPKNPKHSDYCKLMTEHGVPDWYIWSCDTIKYMFPKAHAAAYVVMSSRIAYYKIHYPLEYYAAYYTVKADGFDYEKMCVNLEKLRYNLKKHREYMTTQFDASANDKALLRDMRIVEEMLARGFEFAPIDIYKAKAKKYIITEDRKIMPSLNSIAGLGEKAAEAIENAAKDGPFISMEDFLQRTKVNKTSADLMKQLGLLGTIPETNQLSIFDFA